MAKPEWLYDILLLLHDAGDLPREAVVSRLGKFVRPELAARAHNQSRHGDSQRHIDSEDLDNAVRSGKHIIIVRSITAALRGGYVKLRNGQVSLTKSGLDKLIRVKPHRLSLPMSVEQGLGSAFNQIKSRLKDNSNTHAATYNKGLMEALSIIHRVTRNSSEGP